MASKSRFKEERYYNAAERKEAAAKRTPEEQIRRLDGRPGLAKKERSKLAARIAISRNREKA